MHSYGNFYCYKHVINIRIDETEVPFMWIYYIGIR
jgi:hypothetical protein